MDPSLVYLLSDHLLRQLYTADMMQAGGQLGRLNGFYSELCILSYTDVKTAYTDINNKLG